MNERTCNKCGKLIPQARLDVLPETTTCVQCSGVKAKKVYSVYSHKTAPELITIEADDTESIRLAERAHKRSR